jgi:hypothetical protein
MKPFANLVRLLGAAAFLFSTAPSVLDAQAAPGDTNLRLRLVPPGQSSLDLGRLSFEEVSALIEGARGEGELVLPLPFAGKSSFAPIDVREVEVTLDAQRRTLVLAGSATLRGRGGRVFLSGTYTGSGPGQFALGVAPDRLVLGEWFPSLAATALGSIAYEKSGLVVASAKHTLPASRLVAGILGLADAGKGIELEAGVSLHSTLAVQSLPALAQLLGALGIEQAELRQSGRIGSSVDLLFAALDGKDSKGVPLELELHSALEATAMKGLQERLPPWIQPTGFGPSLDFSLKTGADRSKVEKVVVKATQRVKVEVAGESLEFSLSAEVDTNQKDAKVTLTGTRTWKNPLGIAWLKALETTLALSVDDKAASADKLQAKLTSSLKIGATVAALEFQIEGEQGKQDSLEGQLVARLERLSIGDLADFTSSLTGASFLSDLKLGDAAALEKVSLTLKHEKERGDTLEVSAQAALGGAGADVLFTLRGGKGELEPLFALRRRGGRLSDLVPALAGKAGDLEFPESLWALSPPSKAGIARTLSSADLGPTAREFFRGVHGPDFRLELRPGIEFGATLPVAKLPAALIKTLGLQGDANLVVAGSLAMNLDLGQGRPSASLQSLELQAELPRTSGVAARLPEGLPAWMRVESSSKRALTLRFTAPASLAFLHTNDVLADLDGQTRHFRISTEVSADSKQGQARLSGSLIGDWKQPFGLKPLTLRDVTLAAEGQAQAGQAGKRSGGLALEGGFDLGPKKGRMRLELGAVSGQGISGSFTGKLDSLGFEDLSRIELFPNLPREGLERLASTLGQLPPLREPTLHVALGGGQPSITLSAQVELRGARAHLLAFVGKGKGGPEAILALRPENFSLAKLFPALGQNPIVAPLANLPLDRFGLFVVLGEQTLKASETEPEVRAFFADVTGEKDFELKLSAGLNLEARLGADQLPPDLKDALKRLNQTMGLDDPGSLSLRGTIGASLADLRLAAALPPLRPARAPKWLKSGELAFVLTGTPSFMLVATLVVDCEGDLLNLSVEGGVTRQGTNVALELRSALQADEAWTSPFGMEWLEIRRFSGSLSIDALANIGFGGRGDVTIGSKDIDVLAWTKINSVTGVPMGLVVNGDSKEGFALLDLAELQAKMRKAAGVGGPRVLPLQTLPDIALRDLALLIASRAVPEEGIDSAGFKLKGDLYIPLKPGASGTKFVAVDCGVSKEGILAKGFLGAYQVGPLTWEDSYVDLEATLAAQHLLVHGRVEFLGSSSETDLQFTREKLAFESAREIQGLGRTQLLVESKFDLKKPSFLARGQLDSEFAEAFGASALGELTDVTGKAAALGAATQAAFTEARDGLEQVRKDAGLLSALETIDAVAAQRVKEAEAAALAHKKDMDAKYKAWQDTPASEPAKRKARELVWGQSKIAYDEGPLSKIKVLERRKAEYREVHGGVAALEAAKAENQRVQAALGDTLQELADYSGKTIVVTSAAIESSLEDLSLLAPGVPVDMTLELIFCGKPRTVEFPWLIGNPPANAKTLVTILMPMVSKLVNG